MDVTEVVHWGRDLDEYCQMFALTDQDLDKRILGCSDGPACFNAEMTRQKRSVVSFDPLYGLPLAHIEERVRQGSEFGRSYSSTHRHDLFRWETQGYTDVDDVADRHDAAMSLFLEDFRTEGEGQRYVAGGLPELPFADDSFDLALCGHFLFLYSHLLSLRYHLDSIHQLLRVAREVRIHPLIDLTPARSPYVEPVMNALRAEGHHVNLLDLGCYERLANGGNTTLQICRR